MSSAGEVLRQQAEHRRLVHLAQHVHALLDVAAGRVQLRAQALRDQFQVKRRVEHPVVEQLVEQQRMAGDELRRPARRADDARHALERLGVLGEQREVGGAAGDRLDQVHAARKRRLRIRRRARGARQRRDQALEAALRLRRQRGIALAREQRGEARMIGPRLLRRLGLGEHFLEVVRDLVAMRAQPLVEALPGREAAHLRHARAVLFVFRKIMALRVVEVLQAVLEVAQERVRVGQLEGRAGQQELLAREDRQRLQRRPHAQLGSRPPRISWIACTMNSISRMPPGPSLTCSASSRRATSRATSAFSARIAASMA